MAPLKTGEPAGARGVFETLLVRKGRPVFFEEHVERFAKGCAHYRLEGAPGADDLRTAAANSIASIGLDYGVLCWSAWTDGSPVPAFWSISATPPRDHMMKATWTAKVSHAPMPSPGPESAHKHLGRKAWLESLAVARAAGADEAILADSEGRVIEGAVSNVFHISKGILTTPPLSLGPLPGIVRGKVLALARELKIPTAEEPVTLDALEKADEIFLTNSLIGIRPLAALDDRRLPAPGPITAKLQAEWTRRYG
jgi:branched-chain amino acid aminotransferase